MSLWVLLSEIAGTVSAYAELGIVAVLARKVGVNVVCVNADVEVVTSGSRDIQEETFNIP